MPRVWNVRSPHCPRHAIYVGRPTKWGNPFREGYDGTRLEVIAMFYYWIMTKPDLLALAKIELRGKDLSCWCEPQPCHADVLIEIANG